MTLGRIMAMESIGMHLKADCLAIGLQNNKGWIHHTVTGDVAALVANILDT